MSNTFSAEQLGHIDDLVDMCNESIGPEAELIDQPVQKYLTEFNAVWGQDYPTCPIDFIKMACEDLPSGLDFYRMSNVIANYLVNEAHRLVTPLDEGKWKPSVVGATKMRYEMYHAHGLDSFFVVNDILKQNKELFTDEEQEVVVAMMLMHDMASAVPGNGVVQKVNGQAKATWEDVSKVLNDSGFTGDQVQFAQSLYDATDYSPNNPFLENHGGIDFQIGDVFEQYGVNPSNVSEPSIPNIRHIIKYVDEVVKKRTSSGVEVANSCDISSKIEKAKFLLAWVDIVSQLESPNYFKAVECELGFKNSETQRAHTINEMFFFAIAGFSMAHAMGFVIPDRIYNQFEGASYDLVNGIYDEELKNRLSPLFLVNY